MLVAREAALFLPVNSSFTDAIVPRKTLQARPDKKLIDMTTAALADQRAVSWSQGRMEFGPRSLGARLILGDPRSPTTPTEGQVSREPSAVRAFGPALKVLNW